MYLILAALFLNSCSHNPEPSDAKNKHSTPADSSSFLPEKRAYKPTQFLDFSHSAHAKTDCKTCHVPKVKKIDPTVCSGCHKP